MDDYTFLSYEGGAIYVSQRRSPLAMKGINNFETEKVRFIKEHIRPGHTFIDVGACEGFYTLLAARFVGNDGKVIALEPEDRNFDRLTVSARLNNYTNIQALPYAVDSKSKPGPVNLWLAQQVGRHTLRETGPSNDTTYRSQKTFVRSLNDVLQELEIDEFVGGMKIDVEGYELRVLEGASLALRWCSYVAVDIHRAYGINRFDVEVFLNKHGFIIDDSYSRDNEVFAVYGE